MSQIGAISPTITAFVVVLIGLAFLVYRSKTTHFECPNCGFLFKLSGLSFAFTLHIGLHRFVMCPNCGYRGMMPTIND